MPSRIEDYALIGDCETAALVSRDGSIDWLCLPRFDSGACFAALLGTSDHGCWSLTPAETIRKSKRKYRGNTLILETDYETENGAIRVVDCMPLRCGPPILIRTVTGLQGKVRMRTQLNIRFDYGSVIPWTRYTDFGLSATAGPDSIYLFTDLKLHGEESRSSGEFEISKNETRTFVLIWSASHKPQPENIDVETAVKETEAQWNSWSDRCTYQGEWRDAVLRSLITLKALTYAPTGGIIAAATTSLPEFIGGVRNWDYRFCWLRDATFTLYSLLVSGYQEEAAAWREWLLRAVAGQASQLNILYGLAGERRLNEFTLDWLPGYENSRPVRIGNAAWKQFQLDVFGEIMDVLHVARRAGLSPNFDSWHVQQELLNFLETHWQEPDEGIWEVRGPRQHFTHSKVMAWVAFDRGVMHPARKKVVSPGESWEKIRDTIHADVCKRGFDTDLQSFVQYYGSKELDASLLMMVPVGFLPADDPRMKSTIAAIEKHLVKDDFVLRYRSVSGVDGLPPDEGAFLPCTFWLADNYALQGRHDEACKIFERLLQIRNDVGLLSEEYDVVNKRLVGNFPQAFSHVGLINTAHNLANHDAPAKNRCQK